MCVVSAFVADGDVVAIVVVAVLDYTCEVIKSTQLDIIAPPISRICTLTLLNVAFPFFLDLIELLAVKLLLSKANCNKIDLGDIWTVNISWPYVGVYGWQPHNTLSLTAE